MAVRATVARFPMDPDALESSGLPWGVTITPFAAKDESGNPPLYGSDGHLLPRCENCWAYYNTYCEQEQWAWTCSLCGTLNGLSSQTISRYSLPDSCPENISSFIDLELPMEGYEEEAMQARPVYVAAVDLSSLGPGSLFGLATFSHKIGLYDVQGPVPVVKNVFIPPDSDGTLPTELEDVMPLLSFLAPVDTCKDRIASALETLRPTNSWERTTAAGQGLDGVLLGGRGFGVAMEALFNYLSSEYGNTFALGRVFAFLSGSPDYGAGQLDTRRYGEQYASKGEDADRALLPEQTPFYKDLAAVAAQSGVCVDIFAVTNEYTDLASLKFLSIESGGSLFLYSNTDDSTLPQDIHTSEPPMLQIAFQYTVVVPPEELSNSEPSSTSRNKYSLKRRIRIRTLQFGTARNINELYDSVDPEAILSILVHKVISASLEKGVREGRMLLHDWLVILTAQYNDACKVVQYEHGNSTTSHIDVAFSQCPQLQPLPRLVFALLRNPLLRFHEEGVHPDYRIYLQCLFSALEPSYLHRAIYPLLTSYATPDKQAFPRHSLSRAALITSGSPIFFLDAFTTLIVFYSSTADPSLPFPPPHDCLLRTTINKLKQERSITPRLVFIRGGQNDATAFENYLIEEQDVDGNGFTSVMGFVSFLEEINHSVLEYMK
ncbi:hypothetical protein TEA_014051 [Camellia sinensis var. sinensis]|uniref:Sec23/Sec24 trunk domain-containing protein n=1 Tax=Camellia sinensis var. sinensis TaxID=542762 RepID=A0A4V3WLY7_CAMSN|nr:hypothetical protein TEA_014051 [Camellia sinensis var. sinensis]